MRMTSWILALGLFTVGCTSSGAQNNDDPGGTPDGAVTDGPGPDGPGGPNGPKVNQSGSRMKMNVLNTPDGAKAFASWRDTQLNLDCHFQLAADGVTRCLPVTDTYHVGNNYFADAACTVPVATRSTCLGPEPKHILRYPDQTCPTGGYRVYQAGTKYTSAYLRSGANCIAIAPSPPLAYYALGAEIPASTFQSATIAVE